MPFIGNQPALSYTSFAKQDFTTSATTSYTLDNPVTNENELALFINFVRQEPTTAYSASGTSLTLTSATSASDDMYCVYLGKAVQTVNPPNGSVGASQIADSSIALGKLSATGTKDNTTFLRGDNTFAVAGGTNTPYFLRYSTAQSITTNTETVLQLAGAVYDTDSYWDGTNYYYKPLVAGTYCVFAKQCFNDLSDFEIAQLRIYKNTTKIAEFQVRNEFVDGQSLTLIAELNGSTDYIQFKAYHEKGSSVTSGDGTLSSSFAGAYKLIT